MDIVVNGIMFKVCFGQIFRIDNVAQPAHEWVFIGLYADNEQEALKNIITYLN